MKTYLPVIFIAALLPGVFSICLYFSPILDIKELQKNLAHVEILSVEEVEDASFRDVKVKLIGQDDDSVTLGHLIMPTEVDLSSNPLYIKKTPNLVVGATGKIHIVNKGRDVESATFVEFK